MMPFSSVKYTERKQSGHKESAHEDYQEVRNHSPVLDDEA